MKLIVLIFIISLSIFSCRNSEWKYQSVGKFQNQMDWKAPGLTKVDFLISYDTLFKWLNVVPGQILYDSNKENSNFPLQITLAGKSKIKALSKNELELQVPIHWVAEPNLSGFSAGKVYGKMQLTIHSKLDISNYRNIKLIQSDFEYEWIEKPSIKVVGFGVNVSGLIDQLIKTKKQGLIESISNYANSALNFSYLEKYLNRELKPFVFQDFLFYNYHTQVGLDQMQFGEQGLSGLLKIKSQVELADKWNFVAHKESSKIEFTDILENSESSLAFNVNLSFKYLEKMFSDNLATELKNAGSTLKFIQADSSNIIFELQKFKGKNSQMKLAVRPVIFNNEQIGIKVDQLKISHLSFPISIFNKAVAKQVFRKLNEYSFNMNSSIQALLENNHLVETKGYKLILDNIQWNNQSLTIQGSILGQHSLKK